MLFFCIVILLLLSSYNQTQSFCGIGYPGLLKVRHVWVISLGFPVSRPQRAISRTLRMHAEVSEAYPANCVWLLYEF